MGYESSHTGSQIDAAVAAVLGGDGVTSMPDRTTAVEEAIATLQDTVGGHTTALASQGGRLATAEADIDSLETLASSGYRIAGFVGPDNSYLSKAVEGTCFFATNPGASSWYDNVAGRVYLPPTSWTPNGDTRPSNVTGWTKVELSSQDYAGFAILFGFKNGAWAVHRLPYALQTTIESVQSSLNSANSNIAATNARLGYYTCSTGGSTAAKAVTATGYTLPTNGGHMKIKMTNANTVANATLNINSTGAKALYYCGERASATNTWEANEIIEVFYDGSNYQSAPFAGGGSGGGVTVLEWSTNAKNTRNTIPNAQREKGMLITYQNPNVANDGGWVIEQLVGDPVANNLFGDDLRWLQIPYNTSININTTNGICRIFSINTVNGVYDNLTNTISWGASDSLDRSEGFLCSVGQFDKDIVKRMLKLYNMGIKPSIKIMIETSNLNAGGSFYSYNKLGALQNNYGFNNKTEFDKTIYYKDNFDIDENTSYFTFRMGVNTKVDASLASSLRLISADIYYNNPVWNNYLKYGEEYDPIQRELRLDTANPNSSKYIKVIDDRTVQIAIPAGTTLFARDILIPLQSFPIPLDRKEGIGGGMFFTIEYEGDSPEPLTFWEVSVAPSSTIFTIGTKQTSPVVQNTIFYAGSFNQNNINNYKNNYNYSNLAIRCGCTSQTTLSNDIICKLRFKVTGWNFEDIVMDELESLRQQVYDLRKAIGIYNSDASKPFLSIVGKSSNVKLDDSYSCSIPSGTAMSGEYVDLLVDVSKARNLGIENPTFYIRLATDKTEASAIPITSTVRTESNAFQIQTAQTVYDEIYNSYVDINFNLLKQTSGVHRVIVRVSFTSSSTDGMTMSVVNSYINGVGIRDDIKTEIDYLKDYNRPLYVKSANGTKYRIAVDNSGNLITAPAVPTKMMFLAHSWGCIFANKGWHGNWGLCASAEHLDLLGQTKSMFQTVSPEFTTFFKNFAAFGPNCDNISYWEQNYDCEDLDFDSICIASFAAQPSSYTNFANKLYDCITNYVCKGKSAIPVFILDTGFGGDDQLTQLRTAAGLFGTQLVEGAREWASDRNMTGWPWKMPPDPETGIYPLKRMALPEGADPNLYMLNGPLTHPGNWGFYRLAKKLVNEMYRYYGLTNPDPTILTFDQYRMQLDIAPYFDNKYNPETKTYDET